MIKLMTFVVAGALFAAIGCATSGGGAAPQTTPAPAASPDAGAPTGEAAPAPAAEPAK